MIFPVNHPDNPPNYSLGTPIAPPLALSGIDPITVGNISEVEGSILHFVTEEDSGRPYHEKTVYVKNGTRPIVVFRPGHREDLVPGNLAELSSETVCELVTIVLNKGENPRPWNS